MAAPPSSPQTPAARVSMTDPDVVERVAALFGRAVVSVRPRRSDHRTAFMTTIKGRDAIALMTTVRPHLSERRRKQIDAATAPWARTGDVIGRALVTPGPRATHDPSLELAWLAGLLEGEGYFGIARRGARAYPAIGLEMCDRQPVARSAVLLGAAGVARREPRHERWQATYTTGVVGRRASDWMARLRPLMGARRGVAIDKALAAYEPIRLSGAPATCVVPECDDSHEARGLCHKHYMSSLRDVTQGRAPRVTPLR